jgi:ribulose kinase
MAIIAGVDFGTLNVRVSIVDSGRGLLASAIGSTAAAKILNTPRNHMWIT